VNDIELQKIINKVLEIADFANVAVTNDGTFYEIIIDN
jgi:hypothetical protein